LFVGGVMNLYWIIGLAAFVFLEKMLVRATWLVPVSGFALLVAGVLVLVGIP
jgi:predicted metal-binding membrane protein